MRASRMTASTRSKNSENALRPKTRAISARAFWARSMGGVIIAPPMQPAQFGRAGMAVFENQPGEVHATTTGLVAGLQVRTWRHRRSRRYQPDAAERGAF